MSNDLKNLMHILSYKRPHGSRTEEEFIRNVLFKRCPQLRAIGPDGAETNYAIEVGKHSKTLFSCHLDTVHRNGGRQTPRLDKTVEIIFAPKNDCLGADNGAGIWLLLSMIDARVPGYYVFHRGEERGGIGSRWLSNNSIPLLKGFDRAVAFDRRDSVSIITHQGGERCCSQKFALALGVALEDQHEPDATGSFTDTKNYVDIIPECTNVSVGYMNEHGPDEYLDMGYLFWLANQVKKVDWEALPVERDPMVTEYDGYRSYHYGSSYGYASHSSKPDDEQDKDITTTTTFEDTLAFVQDFPEDAAWLLQNYMEENGWNLSDLLNGYDPDTNEGTKLGAMPQRKEPDPLTDEDAEIERFNNLYGG